MSTVQPPHSRAYLHYVLTVLAAVNVLNYTDRMALAVLAPLIKSELHLTDTQLGLLSGFASALFYAVFAIPIALVADRWIRRTLIAIATGIWSAMTAASGLAQNFVQLFATRIGVGVGESGSLPPAHSLLSDYFLPAQRASALGIYTAGASVGIALGLALGGVLSQHLGWRTTFVVLGAPGLLLAALVMLTIREPARQSGGMAQGSAPLSLRETAATLWRCKSYLHILAFFAYASFGSFGASQWLPSFYSREFHLSQAQIGIFFGFALGAGATLGVLAGGFISDSLTPRDPRWPLWISMGTGVVALPLACGIYLSSSATQALSFNLASAAVGAFANGPLYALVQTIVPVRTRATSASLVMFAMALIGAGGGPFAVGMLSDGLAPVYGPESLRWSLLWINFIAVLPIAHLFFASRTLIRDIGAAATERGYNARQAMKAAR
jgi:predicted MFS family arabinose efflux permease